MNVNELKRKDVIALPVAPAVHALQKIMHLIYEAEVADCPAVIGMLEQLKAYAWARILHSPVSDGADSNDLMDMVQVSKKLNIPQCRAYELARQGKISTVRIGKYVRVSCRALKKYQEQLET